MEELNHKKGCNLILAGPGTGKTYTLVKRIVELIKNSTIKGIVICTFTKKATEELEQRIYSELSKDEINKQNILIGTIHSICYELLSRYSKTDSGNFDILPEDEQINFIHSKLENLRYDEKTSTKNSWNVAENLSMIFNKITDQQINYKLINTNDLEIDFAIRAYPIYKKLLKRYRLFDFATIQETFLDELNNSTSFKSSIKDDFEYFFVDEYQDVNPIQHKIFTALTEPELNLTVVGDDDQCIYEFRGSDVSIIRGFEKEFNQKDVKVTTEILKVNYRSTNEIVNFTNKLLLHQPEQGIAKNIQANRKGDSHKVVIKEFADSKEEADYLSITIKELKQRNIIKSYNEVAILFRSIKNQAKSVIKSFNSQGIPYIMYGAGNFFSTQIGKEFIAILDFYLAKENNNEEIFYHALENIDEELDVDITSEYVSNDYILKLNELFNSKKYHSCIDLTYDIINTTNMLERYSDIGMSIGKITQMVASYDNYASSFDPYGLYSYLTYLSSKQKIDDEVEISKNAIQIMTIHQSKGLEFPVVFLPSQVIRSETKGIQERFDEIANITKSTSEKFRTLYVACTRAEELLVITSSKRIEGTKKTYETNKYINAVSFDYNKANIINFDILHNQIFRDRKKESKKDIVLSYNSIALYMMCPLAYKYSHVWHLETVRIGGMEFGQNVHSAAEAILKRIKSGESIGSINITDEIEKTWSKSLTKNIVEDDKLKKSAIEQVQIFVNQSKDYLKQENVVSSEEPFNTRIEGISVTGRFDAVFKFNKEYVILDFKTGDERDYTPQLTFYSICFNEKYKITPALKVYFLKTGRYLDITPSDKNKEIEKIKLIANNISNGVFNATPGKACRSCAYNKICSKK